jgi:hypothetical protein
MPTVALLNGHTFAGGLMVAMMHDYRIMNPHRGYLCLNELELGMGLRPPMCSVFREKVGAGTFRKLILEAVRFKVSFTLFLPWVVRLACFGNMLHCCHVFSEMYADRTGY